MQNRFPLQASSQYYSATLSNTDSKWHLSRHPASYDSIYDRRLHHPTRLSSVTRPSQLKSFLRCRNDCRCLILRVILPAPSSIQANGTVRIPRGKHDDNHVCNNTRRKNGPRTLYLIQKIRALAALACIVDWIPQIESCIAWLLILRYLLSGPKILRRLLHKANVRRACYIVYSDIDLGMGTSAYSDWLPLVFFIWV